MTEERLAAVAAGISIRDYRRDAEIVAVQERSTDVLFVLDGRVRVTNFAENGREFIYTEFAAGEFFGEFSAIDGLPRSASVVALEPSNIGRLSAQAFWELLRADFQATEHILKLLVAKSRDLSDRLLALAAVNLSERLVAELYRLACKAPQAGRSAIIAPAPTHYEIAARIGSHREAVTKELNRLEEQGYVAASRRKIVIVDLARFVADLLPPHRALAL